jgi:hypothetical protein
MSAITVPDWQPPWPSKGEPTFLRISASSLSGDSRWNCPEQLAKKARPQVSPESDPRVRPVYPPFESVPIGLVRTALFSILAKSVDIDRGLDVAYSEAKADIADETKSAVRVGVEGYLSIMETLRRNGDLPAQTIVREFMAFDDLTGDIPRLEWYGWGLLHTSADSAIREYHLLTWSRADERERSPATLGVYARIAADAVCVNDGVGWWEPRTPTPAQPRPGREVRIRELGLLDGSHRLHYADTVDAARAFFDTHVPQSLSVLAGGHFHTTGRCASCNLRTACPGVHRMPGLLGVIGETGWPRAYSPSDLAHAEHCLRQVHYSRDLGLPRSPTEGTEAMRRGQDVHAWLEHRHADREPCTEDDLPLDRLPDLALRLGWSMERYVALRPYLISHVSVCALRRYDPDTAIPETTLGGWDTDANVVMSTRADLVIADGDTAVVRETKTVHDMDDSMTDRQLLHRYPQLALTLCLLADGLDPLTGQLRTPARSARVEVEFLGLDGATVRTFDTTDPETVHAARIRLAEPVDRLMYAPPTPGPGRWCDFCPVSRWCDARPGEGDSWAEDSAESSPLGDSGGDSGSRTALLALAETAGFDPDDDIPF